ncbi:hypothetical protein DFA_00569 [Cavenderia fasciculata]|uniref:Transmembrane protein n=1 Tax=Cavenderia fasciculata TaxID=261658 RepID=F4PSL6_CACFS|nr:uncharacterized protein DFA_00569 [Cavenderia fasciculata]EGG20708.1 hypothetical protein DFA_00569 [Cavenderia fasciculata]|eukprot:XP_004358558.1 hypothetical protein DFA_00569 [Cavenderia fasciculata]
MMHAVEMLKPDDPPLKRSKEPCGLWCCCVFTIALLIRLLCLVAGGVQTAMGGYTFFMIVGTKDKSAVNILQLTVIGIFGLMTGVMILYAELRNRWTRKSLKVFIFLCNGLARGLVYILVGCINIPIPFKVKLGIEITAMYIGFFIIGAGFLSLIFWAFTWRRKRLMHRNDIAAHQISEHKTQIYELFEQKQTADPKQQKGDVEMKPVQEA